MNASSTGYLARGTGWQLDCYPVPGARLFGALEQWRGTFPEFDTRWPFIERQENMAGY